MPGSHRGLYQNKYVHLMRIFLGDTDAGLTVAYDRFHYGGTADSYDFSDAIMRTNDASMFAVWDGNSWFPVDTLPITPGATALRRFLFPSLGCSGLRNVAPTSEPCYDVWVTFQSCFREYNTSTFYSQSFTDHCSTHRKLMLHSLSVALQHGRLTSLFPAGL